MSTLPYNNTLIVLCAAGKVNPIFSAGVNKEMRGFRFFGKSRVARWKMVWYNEDMKKKIAVLTVMCLLLSGCYRVMDRYEAQRDEYWVAASCYPLYALSLMALKDAPGIALTCLIQPQDGCLRDYQLSEWDAARAAGYDALILGGRGLESYESALRGWEDGPIVTCVLYGLELKNAGVTGSGDESSHFDTENPWLFLSPEGAKDIVSAISANMGEMDPEYGELYAGNLAAALDELDETAKDMRAEMAGATRSKAAILHEGLGYFAEFMGLETVCVYRRESGAEVSDNMMDEMLAQLAEAGAEVALVEKQAPDSLTDALVEAGLRVCRVDTLSAHPADGDAGAYCRIMRENAKRLAEACR